MKKIKLFKLEEMKDGTIRLQSQLMIGKSSADFIIKDGFLKCYSHGKHGFDFYEYKEPYEIVENVKDMNRQPL